MMRYSWWNRATITIGMVFLFGCTPSSDNSSTGSVVRPVKLLTIADGQSETMHRFPAHVVASEEATISFRVPGELTALPVKPADRVEKGQLLATLDERDFKTQLALRQTDHMLAQRDFSRVAQLKEKNVLSQSDFDNAQARVDSAQAALKLAEDQLADASLNAPFSGRVAYVAVDNYQYIQPQQAILTLQSDKALDIYIQLPEGLLSQLNASQVDLTYQPEVSFVGSDVRYPVTYKQHATQVTPGTQAYEVVFSLSLPNNGHIIYPGMGATLHLDLSRVMPGSLDPQRFTVPVSAVLVDDRTGKALVWRFEDGEVQPVEVMTHKVTSKGVVIEGPLQSGDQLVTAGLGQLRTGMKVKPLQRERGL
ncbi:efflux RND transporter periplasmic adaptor subunit [Thaumasiovibrio sp. DFM-14]|uniref:efflux RND transporter periplasmic adaptor subunit n=1 Tax=Thaumasiovibrio sp. DFM-14 TaxID=3384792 RepID=UPI0039A2CEFF